MLLSILIPYTEDRIGMLLSLKNKIEFSCPASFRDKIEILTDGRDKSVNVGAKRNSLLQRATGEWLCYIDSDDDINPKYVELLLEGIQKGVDCCSLKGVMTTNGKNPEIFEHSLIYDKWETIETAKEGEVKYIRTPNHLSCIKASIAKQFSFPEIRYGEDHIYSKALNNSGLLKTEHYINEILYYYLYTPNKPK